MNFLSQLRLAAVLLAGLRKASLLGKLLSATEVAAKTSMSVSNVRRVVREGKFPPPFALTENRQGWLEQDVDEWISECLRKHHAGGKYAR